MLWILLKQKMVSIKNKLTYKPGKHPNSLANLTHEGRPKSYDTEKKQRYLSITEEGWRGVKEIVVEAKCKSVSELLEKLGRKELKIVSEQFS